MSDDSIKSVFKRYAPEGEKIEISYQRYTEKFPELQGILNGTRIIKMKVVKNIPSFIRLGPYVGTVS